MNSSAQISRIRFSDSRKAPEPGFAGVSSDSLPPAGGKVSFSDLRPGLALYPLGAGGQGGGWWKFPAEGTEVEQSLPTSLPKHPIHADPLGPQLCQGFPYGDSRRKTNT